MPRKDETKAAPDDPCTVAVLIASSSEVLGFLPLHGSKEEYAKESKARVVSKATADSLATMWNDHARKNKTGRAYEVRPVLL